MEELNRTFVGIRLPAEARPKITEAQQAVRHRAGSDLVRWSGANELELTFLPLGELTVQAFDQVKRVLAEVARGLAPFELSLEGLGGTPSALQPRYVWVGISKGREEVIQARNAALAATRPYLPRFEERPFQPVLDLGRLKAESEQNRTSLGRAIRMTQLAEIASFTVSNFELFRSTASTAGPRLLSEQSYPLG